MSNPRRDILAVKRLAKQQREALAAKAPHHDVKAQAPKTEAANARH